MDLVSISAASDLTGHTWGAVIEACRISDPVDASCTSTGSQSRNFCSHFLALSLSSVSISDDNTLGFETGLWLEETQSLPLLLWPDL